MKNTINKVAEFILNNELKSDNTISVIHNPTDKSISITTYDTLIAVADLKDLDFNIDKSLAISKLEEVKHLPSLLDFYLEYYNLDKEEKMEYVFNTILKFPKEIGISIK